MGKIAQNSDCHWERYSLLVHCYARTPRTDQKIPDF
ncbi:hypothetical protein XENTR_v10020393 [Xenopus tropicalis]|nr:hypothetical protein XENTR_v10020393 [Xenopus tropicalis]